MQGAQRGTSSQATWHIVLLFIGLILLGIYLMFVAFAPKSGHLTMEAEGYVSKVEVRERESKGKTKRTYLTYVTFTDTDHRTFTARSVVNGSRQHHFEGDQVTVHYDPKDPEAGCLIVGDEDDLLLFNALRYGCGLGGGLTLAVSIAGFVYYRFLRESAA